MNGIQIDPHMAILMVVASGVTMVMVRMGLSSHLLTRRRHSSKCPSCGRFFEGSGCPNCGR